MRYVLSLKDIKKLVDVRSTPNAKLICNDVPVCVDFAQQRTGFGYKVFMVCPQCEGRRTKLYLVNRALACRDCISTNVYRGVQHTRRGSCDYITYKMHRYAQKIGIDFKRHPFCYLDYEKPKHKHWDKWEMSLIVMQALANMRFQTIFMQKTWDKKTIDSVLNFKNSLLYLYSLYEIDKYILDWDRGVDMNTRF